MLLEAACRELDAHPLEHRGHLTLAYLRAGELPVQFFDAGGVQPGAHRRQSGVNRPAARVGIQRCRFACPFSTN